MEIDREVLVQIAVGGGVTVLFIAMVVAVGAQSADRGLDPDGAMLLVGVIVGFVVLLAVLGIGLGERMGATDEDDESGSDSSAE